MNRTASMVAGLLFLLIGAFVLLRGASVTTQRDVLEVGEVKITADEQRAIPPWAGGIAIAAGVALLVAGGRKGA